MGYEIESHVNQELTQLGEIYKIQLDEFVFNYEELCKSLEGILDTWNQMFELLGENTPKLPETIMRYLPDTDISVH